MVRLLVARKEQRPVLLSTADYFFHLKLTEGALGSEINFQSFPSVVLG
jgi:hypothetical protein